jgi:hypothetical protein
MRRCVERLQLACQAVASAKAGVLNRNRKTIEKNYRCRDNNVETLMPKAERTSNARHSQVRRVTPGAPSFQGAEVCPPYLRRVHCVAL